MNKLQLPNIDRKLLPDSPRKKYKKRKTTDPLPNHWGQRKLFLVEVEFLTQYTQKDPEKKTIVIYPGAAPGTHVPFLAKMFPHCHFILIDPSQFRLKGYKKSINNKSSNSSSINIPNTNIEIINDYFTNKMADDFYQKYRNCVGSNNINVLLMSDIRTANWREMEFEENEKFIQKDNQIQLEWCKILKPDKALLKFRLPYLSGTTKYFSGDLYLSPWGPNRTTETRLVPTATKETWNDVADDNMIQWDHIKYEEQLYYFNTKTRMREYEHNVSGEGLTTTYDSCAEIVILYEYLKQFVTSDPTPEDIAKLSYDVSRKISKSHRTLLTILPEPDKRRQFKSIDHKQFYVVDNCV